MYYLLFRPFQLNMAARAEAICRVNYAAALYTLILKPVTAESAKTIADRVVSATFRADERLLHSNLFSRQVLAHIPVNYTFNYNNEKDLYKD
jgi:hypothetical protein